MKRKFAPSPGWLSTQSWPPWRSTIFLQMASPMPVPAITLLAVQALEDHEDAVKVLRVDPDPVVAEGETPEIASPPVRR